MELLGIIALVFLLYLRTLNYNYVIDDSVKRDGYLYDVPDSPPPIEFFKTKPHWGYRLFMIGMHCVNVSVVYLLWGWAPALIFAVHPQAVWGVAWVTGNYYATAAYFTLISYFILHQFPSIIGAAVALPIFAAALNSTICPLNFPFFASVALWPWGLCFFWPFAAFLTGKRFRTGIKIRYNFHQNKKKVDARFTWRRLLLMTRVVARYTYDAIVPTRCGFFGPMGQYMRDDPEIYEQYHSANKDFWASLGVVLSVLLLGVVVDWRAALWFFVIIAIHSQFNITGQFYAQRYLYLPIVGLCVIAGKLLQPYPIALTAVVTFLVIRTHLFIPSWRHMGKVYQNDIENYPENCQVYNNMAQWMLAVGDNVTMTPDRVNELAMYLYKSEKVKPDAWENQMNIAAFLATVNRWDEAYDRTIKSITLLEPLGGVRKPLHCLLEQKVNFEKKLMDQNKKAGEAELGALFHGSSADKDPTGREVGRDHGQRTRSQEAGAEVLEPVGAGIA